MSYLGCRVCRIVLPDDSRSARKEKSDGCRYDLSRVSRETLEECADIVLALRQMTVCPAELSKVASAIQKQARIPLRTRAEVDAEIVREARLFWSTPMEATIQRHDRLSVLCDELTADPEPTSRAQMLEDVRELVNECPDAAIEELRKAP